jgi:hypothetical protein
MNARLRPYAWMGIVVSFLAGLYSFTGVLMAGSMSVAYPDANCRRCALMWMSAVAASLIIAAASIVVLVRTRRQA